jgi:predicted transcriptional regulator
LSGEKRYEYRRKIPSKPIDLIVLYATYPVKKVVGQVEVLDTVKGSVDAMWEKTKYYAGISRDIYKAYFNRREGGYMFVLGRSVRYPKPLRLEDFAIWNAPQNYVYVYLDSNILPFGGPNDWGEINVRD